MQSTCLLTYRYIPTFSPVYLRLHSKRFFNTLTCFFMYFKKVSKGNKLKPGGTLQAREITKLIQWSSGTRLLYYIRYYIIGYLLVYLQGLFCEKTFSASLRDHTCHLPHLRRKQQRCATRTIRLYKLSLLYETFGL